MTLIRCAHVVAIAALSVFPSDAWIHTATPARAALHPCHHQVSRVGARRATPPPLLMSEEGTSSSEGDAGGDEAEPEVAWAVSDTGLKTFDEVRFERRARAPKQDERWRARLFHRSRLTPAGVCGGTGARVPVCVRRLGRRRRRDAGGGRRRERELRRLARRRQGL